MIYLVLFWEFFKIGLFTIGGGYAMLPLIQQIVVGKHAWISQDMFIDFIGVAEATPGVFAVNISTFIGATVVDGLGASVLGAFCATLGVVLPSVIIITLIALFLHKAMQTNRLLLSILDSASYAVVGLILYSFVSVFILSLFSAESILKIDFGNFNYISVTIFAIACLLSFWKKPKFHPIFVIFVSACLGMLMYSFLPAP